MNTPPPPSECQDQGTDPVPYGSKVRLVTTTPQGGLWSARAKVKVICVKVRGGGEGKRYREGKGEDVKKSIFFFFFKQAEKNVTLKVQLETFT